MFIKKEINLLGYNMELSRIIFPEREVTNTGPYFCCKQIDLKGLQSETTHFYRIGKQIFVVKQETLMLLTFIFIKEKTMPCVVNMWGLIYQIFWQKLSVFKYHL